MKILLAINSEKRYKLIADESLRLACRFGYKSVIFVPLKEVNKYRKTITHAEYDYYLERGSIEVIAGQDPKAYARNHGFDLLLTVPDDSTPPYDDKGETRYLLAFAKKVESTRAKFEKGIYKNKKTLGGGVIMEKL